MDAALQRNEWRRDLAAHRRSLTPAERIGAAQGLRRSLEALPEYMTDRRIGAYWAVDGELPLNLALASLEGRDQELWLPRILPGQQLEFVWWRPGEAIQANRYGIPEPTAGAATLAPMELDLVLLPLLAFNRRGHRLGHGAGYYDRSFAQRRRPIAIPRPLLVGVGYAFQERADLLAQAWDVPLDYVATDHELIDCTSARFQEDRPA